MIRLLAEWKETKLLILVKFLQFAHHAEPLDAARHGNVAEHVPADGHAFCPQHMRATLGASMKGTADLGLRHCHDERLAVVGLQHLWQMLNGLFVSHQDDLVGTKFHL